MAATKFKAGADAFRITVKGNTLEAQRWFRAIAGRHLPFATAAALTATAKEARDEMRDSARDRFTVRSRRFVSTFRHIPAEKRDWPRTFSVVGVIDDWVARHELGGTQRPKFRGRWAIPGREIIRKRTKSGKIRKRDRPKALIRSGRGFLAEGETWAGRNKPDAILLKQGRGRRRIRLGYTLEKKIRLGPRLKFVSTVLGNAHKTYGRNFKRWMLHALNTAR